MNNNQWYNIANSIHILAINFLHYTDYKELVMVNIAFLTQSYTKPSKDCYRHRNIT